MLRKVISSKHFKISIAATVLVIIYFINAVRDDVDINFYIKKNYYGDNYNGTRDLFISLIRDEQPPKDSIFFLETSFMKGATRIHLNPRQACSIESATKVYPDTQIYLLILSPEDIDYTIVEDDHYLVHLIANLRNVHLRLINFKEFLNNTPLKRLYEDNVLKTSEYPIAHASDILRYATLYKYSGTYFDLDVISVKRINITNYTAVESADTLGAGAMNFDNNTVGREMARTCAEETSRTFDGTKWLYSPKVLTNVVRKRCQIQEKDKLTPSNCRGFIVLPPSSFYELHWMEYTKFFSKDYLSEVLKRTRESYGIHVWNKLSENIAMTPKDTSIPYLYFAEKYCPIVYNGLNGQFGISLNYTPIYVF